MATLLAAAAGWVIVAGSVPALRLPRVAPRTILPAALSGSAAGILGFGLTAAPMVGAAVAVLVAGGVAAGVAVKGQRARTATADRWPDVLAVMRSRLSGGETVQEAFLSSCAEAGSEELAAWAARIEEAATLGGSRFVSEMEHLRSHLADALADRIIATLIAATRSGGHRVSEIIGALGASVADELRLRKAHQAALTQQRLTAAVALFAPWALLLLTVTSNPQAAAVYRTTTGSLVVAGGLVATVGGYALARRTARLSAPPRVFQ